MDKMTEYAQALIASVTINTIIPLLMFGMMIGCFWYLLYAAQQKPDFNIQQIFLDENGKVAAAPMISLMAFAYSVWLLTTRVLNGKYEPVELFYFLGFWSGTAVALELAKHWDGQLPFTKGKE